MFSQVISACSRVRPFAVTGRVTAARQSSLTVEGLAYCGGTENLFGELGNGTGGALPGVSKGLTPVLGQ